MEKNLNNIKYTASGIKRILCGLTFIITALILWMPGLGAAGEFIFQTSVGYDSNPGLETDGDGTGFSRYTLGFSQIFNLCDIAVLEMLPEIDYQAYWDVEDNQRFSLETYILPKASNNQFLPFFSVGVSAIRDQLITIDERNEVSLGTGADWLISSRYTLSFEGRLLFLNYMSESEPFAYGPPKTPAPPPEPGIDPGPGEVMGIGNQSDVENDPGNDPLYPQLDNPAPARDDRKYSMKINLERFISPSLSGSIGMECAYLDASLDMESYWQLSPRIWINWSFLSQWRVLFDLMYERRAYHKIQDSIPGSKETNHTQIAEIQIIRSFKNMDLFSKFWFEHGEHVLDQESYTKKMIQCGISLSF